MSSNYVSNAIKFTAQGAIRVDVSQVAEDAGSCELLFEVHDTGVGISSDSASQLFRRSNAVRARAGQA